MAVAQAIHPKEIIKGLEYHSRRAVIHANKEQWDEVSKELRHMVAYIVMAKKHSSDGTLIKNIENHIKELLRYTGTLTKKEFLVQFRRYLIPLKSSLVKMLAEKSKIRAA